MANQRSQITDEALVEACLLAHLASNIAMLLPICLEEDTTPVSPGGETSLRLVDDLQVHIAALGHPRENLPEPAATMWRAEESEGNLKAVQRFDGDRRERGGLRTDIAAARLRVPRLARQGDAIADRVGQSTAMQRGASKLRASGLAEAMVEHRRDVGRRRRCGVAALGQ